MVVGEVRNAIERVQEIELVGDVRCVHEVWYEAGEMMRSECETWLVVIFGQKCLLVSALMHSENFEIELMDMVMCLEMSWYLVDVVICYWEIRPGEILGLVGFLAMIHELMARV